MKGFSRSDFGAADASARKQRETPRIGRAVVLDASHDPAGVGGLIQYVSALSGQAVADRMRSYPITHTGWRVLFALAKSNGVFQSALAMELALGKVIVGSVIQALETGGWVVRKREPYDGRLRRVFLTQNSWAALQDIGDVRRTVAERLLGDVAFEDSDALISLLEKLRNNLLRMAAEGGEREGDAFDEEMPASDFWLATTSEFGAKCEHNVEQRINTLTLGVADVQRSRRFYERAFGWRAAEFSSESLVFFELGAIKLALFERTRLAEDAGLPLGRGFGGIALAHSVKSREDVDAVLAQVESANGRIIRPAQEVFWGGYSGYFADPDGHPWEVAYSQVKFPLQADGTIKITSALEII